MTVMLFIKSHTFAQYEENLEVTGEERPKTRLRPRKAIKRLCREKSLFVPSQMNKSLFHFSHAKKSQFEAFLDEKSQLMTKKNPFLLVKILLRTRIDE